MGKKALYLQVVVKDIEPELLGPFKTEGERLIAAINHREEDTDKEDGLFKLDIIDGKPKISTFYGEELEGDEY
jgi:hypothetical protein